MMISSCSRIAWILLLAACLPLQPATAAAAPELDSLVGSCVSNSSMRIGGGVIRIDFKPGDYAIGAEPVCRWMALAALAVTDYFGCYPVPSVRVVIKSTSGNGAQGGTTYGDVGDGDGPLIVVPLGRDTTQRRLDNDWVMTHEMVHLAVPSVPQRSHWLEEGIATYVEPIARARLGQLSDEKVWADMLDGMPNGLPKPGDRGLDRTPTWGRTYWGGALFCLLADVEIRSRTGNRKGLMDALRGVLTAGGSIEKDESVDAVFAAGDRAIGLPILASLYARMGSAPGQSELESLWKRLGVSAAAGSVNFDDGAPLAAVRKAITAPAVPILAQTDHASLRTRLTASSQPP